VATNNELLGFVREALARGATRPQIQDALARAGWSAEVIGDALGTYADCDFAVPVPKPRAYLSAREAFTYLLLFGLLYLTAYNSGVLIFEYINRALPDVADWADTEYSRAAIRWALSSLVVAFPVFLYLSMQVERGLRRDPVKRRSNMRRWLMYLTVFVAASVLIGDFITLVYNVLGGEVTSRFVLKVLTIATIAGTVFAYYVGDLKLEETAKLAERRSWPTAIARFAIVAVAVVVTGGFIAAGPPSIERARRLDARAVEDLQGIASAINVYVHRHGKLPESIDVLAGESIARAEPFAGPYDYRVKGEAAYELCATFQRDSSESVNRRTNEFWVHGAGRQCFELQPKAVQPD